MRRGGASDSGEWEEKGSMKENGIVAQFVDRPVLLKKTGGGGWVVRGGTTQNRGGGLSQITGGSSLRLVRGKGMPINKESRNGERYART